MSVSWGPRMRGALRDVLQTAFRLVPWPTEPGLRTVGQPGPNSPVLVTGNYDLTVRRLLRALRGTDAWVVVAPSSGINVWCAASGGHLTTHQVVTALKTSGVAEQVAHRRAVLPQLAATGVRAHDVARRTGWKVRFGPVYALDIPPYLERDGRKTEAMRHVRFGVLERFEMAVAWAAPTALLVGVIAAVLHGAWALPLAGLATLLAMAVFFAFDRLPHPRPVVLGGFAAGAVAICVLVAGGGVPALATALAACVILTGVLTFDYAGSTPIEGGSHFEERQWHITLDLDRCKGVYSCWEVCPEAVFDKLEHVRKVAFARSEQCIRCGACVVQCPQDALAFENQHGDRVEPDTIRRFKLNLLGQRRVAQADHASADTAAPS